MIRFVDLSRCWNELKQELLPAYEEIHLSGNVANGKYRKLVEEQLKEITGRKHCRLTTSGTTAIQGSLIAWDMIDKDVACSNYSYVASANQAALLNNVQLHDVDNDGNILEGEGPVQGAAVALHGPIHLEKGPRARVIGICLPVSASTAVAPSATTSFGAMKSSSLSSHQR